VLKVGDDDNLEDIKKHHLLNRKEKYRKRV
jgi:hypothetical protein